MKEENVPFSAPGRRLALGAALALIALPIVMVPIEAVAFHAANRENGSFVSAGEKREYVLYVPRTYDRSRPTPLVISMHGAGLWGAAQRDISRWNELADRKGFIVVYPSGVGGNGVRIWRAEPGDGLMRDVRFISDLIDTLSAAYNIDSTRIYANGLSNGGGMSFALSCTLSNRIAAVGLVGSAQTLPWRWCERREEGSGKREEGLFRLFRFMEPLTPLFPTTEALRGSHQDHGQAYRSGRRIGREEIGAPAIPSTRRQRLMSRVVNTPAALTMRR
jgi:poly(3-hydroxybutyrate) depolymerase